MWKLKIKRSILVAITFVALLSLLVNVVSAATVLDGKITVTGTSTVSESNGTVTAKASGGYTSQTTNTITIENTGGSTAKISFNYSASNYSSFSESSANGTYTATLAAGGKYTMSIKGKKAVFSNTATLTLSNFSWEAAAASSTITFKYDSSLGSVSVGGNSVTNGGTVDISSSGATLVAKPNTGVTLLGWVDEETHLKVDLTDGKYLASEDTTLIAAFASAASDAWFVVDGTYWTDDLNEAGSLGTKIALAHNGTLSALTTQDDPTTTTIDESAYTIPSGVTLLIPRDAAHTVYNTAPYAKVYVDFNDVPQVTAFRTLTMASGAKIAVNGSLCVAGVQMYPGAYSSCAGHKTDTNVGFIQMNENSVITINNNANLYAWGFITGSGSVVANSGANVYELFQTANWFGGDLASQIMNDKTREVFPISQYYMQNVEVPMTMYAGAKEYGYFSIGFTSISLSGIGISHETETINFIGSSGALFNLTSGYIIKDYVESEDRLDIKIYGDFSVDALDLTVTLSMTSSNVNINSAERNLPVCHNMTVQILSGTTTINQDLAMLPGSKIIVGTNGTCVLGQGINIYLYDADQKKLPLEATNGDSSYEQGTLHGYTGVYDSYPHLPVPAAPGRTITRSTEELKSGDYLTDATIVVNGTLDASAGNVYGTAGGACIRSDGGGKVIAKAGSQTVTYQGLHYYKSKDHALSFSSVAIQPIGLHNGDGTYDTYGNYNDATIVSTSDASTVATYTYLDSKWCKNHKIVETVTTAATCGKDGVLTKACSGGCGTSTTEVIPANGEHSYNPVVTDPTCGEEGYTTYTCSVCDDTYTGDPVAALGHSYESEVTEPTCTVAGFTTHTCTVCGDTYDDTETQPTGIHTDADGKEDAGFLLCDGCNAPVARLASLEASADAATELRMKFYIHPSLTTAEDGSKLDMKALVQFAGVDPTDELVNLSEMETDKSGRYVFVCNVNSGEMRRNMTVSFADANGNSVIIIDGQASANAVSRSVADYAELVLANGSDKQKNVIKALLTYGGYAQIYFNVDADNPVYNLLGETPNLDAVAIPTLESLDTNFGDIQFTQAEVFLQSAIKMQYTYTAATPDDDSFLLTYAYKNQPYTKAITPTSNTVNENTVYYLVVEEIPAAYFGHKYALAVTEGTNEGTIAMSVYDYLYLLLNPKNQEKAPSLEMINLAKAMYLYGKAANAFFFPVESAQ